ncbi:unnamed protein product [Arabidopsis lyrata]|nr:ervatamin-B [Arabidopsis lyrata subsp. lyrata]CAH8279946.1 unnamed protein product [Arabidopsis lyrata]|eukprot:XP_020871459.1 ervatamin-B [Arabidopsis lyrata subsp. lyrata]
MKRAFSFATGEGFCTASQCTPNTRDNNVFKKLVCRHPDNIHYIKVDEFEYLTNVNDEELQAIVVQQPVIGILRNTNDEFLAIGSGIYRSPSGDVDVNFHQVLIIGYGYDNGKPYWIIQNSYGEGWGNGGFGYVYRRIKSGQGSEFFAVAYPKIRGFPRKPR